MTKFLTLLAIVLMIFIVPGCKKDQSSNSSLSTYDVSFNINNVTQPGSFKSTADINCSTLKANYVTYKMDGGSFVTVPVFYIGNVPYTNTIKLAAGTHILNEFIVYSDNNTPNDLTDDVVISAAPHSGSTYAGYVTTPLDQTFIVTTDRKNDIKLDVVCFESSNYQNFGFVYFTLNQLVVRQQWFFGDICIKNAAEYAGSDYTHQPNWITSGYIDAPAIFKIEVWRGNVLQNTFTNDDAADQYSNKVSVTYGDYQNQRDQFIFKLFVLVPQGAAFNFVEFNDWTFDDISNITQGTDDGVVNFAVGSCFPQANYIFPAWLNLPTQATYTITGWYDAGPYAGPADGGYVTATLSGISAGYDISNGAYASNCTDHAVTITVGQAYTMNVFSSLNQLLLPSWARNTKWNKINWLFNHLSYFPNYQWWDIQGAIWIFDNPAWTGGTEGGYPSGVYNESIMATMVTDMNQYGESYVPPPGGWAAILFIADLNGPTVQTMMIKLDP